MKTNILISLNGRALTENGDLKTLRHYMRVFNAKIERCYTFEMRRGFRRVIKLVAQGTIYSVYGQKRAIAPYAWTQDPLYFGFDKTKAYSFGENSEVHAYKASEINFVQPHLLKQFLGGAE